ncbi:hypothetical protein [Arthrobacter sp. Soil762]|uniref:hypothetical protein n=1 Tax=Arthrobacter sp. Soil762 TaxID=1736401 RepID=UPI00070194EA|nr:hypothetical protein [Arthrobacter sp. Soil762]KRE80974.1 hypothetical protein ASG77_03340 [Arthrobacter sp. Soil762]
MSQFRNLVSADVEVYLNPMARRIRGDATAAAAVMVAGSATFLTGAFMPVSRVYVEGDPQRKLAILLADPGQWSAQQILLAAGTAALPVGVVLLARHWDAGSDRGSPEPLAGQRLAQGAALAWVAGAGLFLGHLKARYTDPEAFALGNMPGWPFQGYMGLSLAGMAALGGGLLARARAHTDSGAMPRDPRWPGWLNVGGAGVFAAVLVGTGDLPPLLVYVVELATGAALIRQVRRGANLGRPA